MTKFEIEQWFTMESATLHPADDFEGPRLVALERIRDLALEQLEQRSRLRALLEGLECEHIDELMTNDPEVLRAVGTEIARAAKLGSPLYSQLMKGIKKK